MNWQEKIYSYQLPMRYTLSEPRDQNLVLLLHGFQDNAHSMLKRLGWTESNLPFQFLAVNAPFPVPIWNADGFRDAYAWYFRDTSRNMVIVDPATTAAKLAQLIKDLSLGNRKITIFGFSQGGYLAPYVARAIDSVEAIISLGCGYTADAYANLRPLPVWALHGSADERIPLAKARAEYEAIATRGFAGLFTELPDHGHKVDSVIDQKIREILRKVQA